MEAGGPTKAHPAGRFSPHHILWKSASDFHLFFSRPILLLPGKKAHSWERIKTPNNTCSIVHVPLFTLKIKRLNLWKMTTCPDVGNDCQWLLNQAHTSVSPCEVVSSFSSSSSSPSSSSSSSSSPSPSFSFSSCLYQQYFLKGKVASSHVGYYYKLYRQSVFSISQRGESKIQYII